MRWQESEIKKIPHRIHLPYQSHASAWFIVPNYDRKIARMAYSWSPFSSHSPAISCIRRFCEFLSLLASLRFTYDVAIKIKCKEEKYKKSRRRYTNLDFFFATNQARDFRNVEAYAARGNMSTTSIWVIAKYFLSNVRVFTHSGCRRFVVHTHQTETNLLGYLSMSSFIFHFRNKRGRQNNLSDVKYTSASRNMRSIKPQQTIRSLIHSIELYRAINMYQNRNNISQSQRHSFFISNRLINFSSSHKD